jgi:hypothetical protein
MEMKEKVDVKMLKLTVENKELKRRMVEWKLYNKNAKRGGME